MINRLLAEVVAATSAAGRGWLAGTITRITARPSHIRTAFPAAGRHCGRRPLPETATDFPGWTVDDGARALMLVALPTDMVVDELTHLYQRGDFAERRAVLRALPLLPIGPAALPLVQDALRTNDSRLISGALGPYGAAHLDDHGFRHAVLKCVFTGIPLGDVAGLPARADRELARMLADYARERIAAGRDVPPDIQPLIDAYPEVGAP
jgi:hypothetical protein